jgi:Fanconi anemia group J protein
MCVLGSKDFYCINPAVSSLPSPSQAWYSFFWPVLLPFSHYKKSDELLESDDACPFKKSHKEFGKIPELALGGSLALHDIEDLVSLGKERKACPFFGSKILAKSASLIFAPYNYVMDPLIRESMALDIEGAVIVFDEAHNIEDVAAASGTFDLDVADLVSTSNCK